jgi:superoxide dismutase, Fe-Mn family
LKRQSGPVSIEKSLFPRNILLWRLFYQPHIYSTYQINNMAFTLPNLPYDFAALEPHVDARTMEIHHGKHHAAYVNNLNAAIQGTDMEGKTLEELMAGISKLPPAVRNNGGGHWNHSMFWEIMAPNAGGEPSGDLASKIVKNFGSFDEMKKLFMQAGATRFGSGWAWLCVDGDDNLFITSTPNQDNPLMDVADKKGMPILGLDVWEHAYYLLYQNRRPDYMAAWWNVVNWEEVGRRYRSAVRAN